MTTKRGKRKKRKKYHFGKLKGKISSDKLEFTIKRKKESKQRKKEKEYNKILYLGINPTIVRLANY